MDRSFRHPLESVYKLSMKLFAVLLGFCSSEDFIFNFSFEELIFFLTFYFIRIL